LLIAVAVVVVVVVVESSFRPTSFFTLLLFVVVFLFSVLLECLILPADSFEFECERHLAEDPSYRSLMVPRTLLFLFFEVIQ
jgi:hypothetical protein